MQRGRVCRRVRMCRGHGIAHRHEHPRRLCLCLYLYLYLCRRRRRCLCVSLSSKETLISASLFPWLPPPLFDVRFNGFGPFV